MNCRSSSNPGPFFRIVVSIALGQAWAAPAYADSAQSLLYLVDRPTVTHATTVLAPNNILFEAGYTNSSYPPLGSVSVYPQARLRIGTMLKNIEIDVKAPSEVRAVGNSAGDDIQTTLKYGIYTAKRTAMSAELSADYDSGTIGNNGTQTSLTLNGSYMISPILALRTSQTITAENVGGAAYGEYTPSFALSARLHQRSLVFGEYAAGTHYNGPGTATRIRYELGASHLVGARLVLDLEGTRSPAANGIPPYTGIGFGAAYRLP